MLKKMGLFSLRALAKASSPHAKPVHGIVRVLEQIRRFFAGEPVRVHNAG